MGTLCGVEMGLAIANVPHRAGGVAAAMASLAALPAAAVRNGDVPPAPDETSGGEVATNVDRPDSATYLHRFVGSAARMRTSRSSSPATDRAGRPARASSRWRSWRR